MKSTENLVNSMTTEDTGARPVPALQHPSVDSIMRIADRYAIAQRASHDSADAIRNELKAALTFELRGWPTPPTKTEAEMDALLRATVLAVDKAVNAARVEGVTGSPEAKEATKNAQVECIGVLRETFNELQGLSHGNQV